VPRAAALALTGLRTAVDCCTIALFAYMTGAIFAQVIGRYVFNFSIAGAEETATFAQIWMVLCGAGIAMRRGQHVGIDVLIVRCPLLVQRIVLVTSTVLGLWFLWILFWGSFRLIQVGSLMRSPAMQWPMSIPYLALPFGAAYFALELALAFVPQWFTPKATDPVAQLADRL
jgi:TRAP-type C4-dicarboxylate transport system permease small subunit